MIFESRKNNVRLENGRIRKTFSSADALANERDTLLALDGICAPKLLGIRGNVLETEYVEGRLLVDEYLAADENGAAVLAERLAGTVRTLYAALGRITFDENFRNYIVDGKKIIRVDFEETTEGTLEEWCAKLQSFALLYDVVDCVKARFCLTLAERLGVKKDALAPVLKKELEFLSGRWNVPFPSALYGKLVAERNA